MYYKESHFYFVVREPGDTAAPKSTDKVAASRQDVYAGECTILLVLLIIYECCIFFFIKNSVIAKS